MERKSPIKVAVMESKLEEAFRHLAVLNEEHGQLRDSVRNLEVNLARVEQRIEEMKDKLGDNTLLTKAVLGTIILGFAAAFLFKAIG